MITCRCIANDNGRCVAETCHGEILRLDVKFSTAQNRKERYESAAQAFDVYFSEDYKDDDLDE